MSTPEARYVRGLAEAGARIAAVDAEAVLGRSRKQSPARVRGAIYAVLRERGWPFSDIGAAFGRDHSTICTVVARHAARMRVDSDYRYLVVQLREAARLTAPAEFIEEEDLTMRVREQIIALESVLTAARRLRDDLSQVLARANEPLKVPVRRAS